MSHLEDGALTCSMCRTTFILERAEPVLTEKPMRTRDVYRCPNCGYYVPVVRVHVAPMA